jgi:hypothetical protein
VLFSSEASIAGGVRAQYTHIKMVVKRQCKTSSYNQHLCGVYTDALGAAIAQGEYKPEYKLAEDFDQLLESAKSGDLPQLLHLHHTTQRTINGTFRGTLMPEVTDRGYRIIIDAHFPLVRTGTAAATTGAGPGPRLGFAPAEAAAKDWRAEAARRFMDGVEMQAEGRTRLAISTDPDLLPVRKVPSLHPLFRS